MNNSIYSDKVISGNAEPNDLSLTAKVAKGMGWASAGMVVIRGLSFIKLIILARLIAPESPGVAFFAASADGGEPGLIQFADELCAKFDQILTDGTGLPESLLKLHQTFSTPREMPALVVSPHWVEPNRHWEDPGLESWFNRKPCGRW